MSSYSYPIIIYNLFFYYTQKYTKHKSHHQIYTCNFNKYELEKPSNSFLSKGVIFFKVKLSSSSYLDFKMLNIFLKGSFA